MVSVMDSQKTEGGGSVVAVLDRQQAEGGESVVAVLDRQQAAGGEMNAEVLVPRFNNFDLLLLWSYGKRVGEKLFLGTPDRWYGPDNQIRWACNHDHLISSYLKSEQFGMDLCGEHMGAPNIPGRDRCPIIIVPWWAEMGGAPTPEDWASVHEGVRFMRETRLSGQIPPELDYRLQMTAPFNVTFQVQAPGGPVEVESIAALIKMEHASREMIRHPEPAE